MKKDYSFNITFDFANNGNSFLDSLMSEIEDEKRQLELTHKINRQTTQRHLEILGDLVIELNKTLTQIGLEFMTPETTIFGGNNEYCPSVAKIHIGNRKWEVKITAESDRNFKDSKYGTYTGDHKILVCHDGSNYSVSENDGTNIVDGILNILRSNIKHYLLNK